MADSALSSRVSLRLTQFCVGLIPFLIVPGINEPDLMPRLLCLQIATLAMTLAWAWKPTPFQSKALYLPALAYFLLLSTSAFWAPVPFRSTDHLSKHITFFCFFVVLSHTLSPRQIPAILRASALAGATVACLGIFEYHALLPHFIPSTGRPSSTFMFRNLAAHYLVTNLPLAGLLFLVSRTVRDRLLGSLSSVLMFIFLLYIRGRGAWVGFFGATLLVLGLWVVMDRRSFFTAIRTTFDRTALKFSAVSLLIIALLGLLPEGFQESHGQRFDEKKADIPSALTSIFKKGGDRGRTAMWLTTLEIIQEEPFLGVGLGNWELVYPAYDRGTTVGVENLPIRPHNDLLWIWSETGTLGLLAYLSLLATCLMLAVRFWRKTEDSRIHLMVAMSCITIFSMIGDGNFNFPYERIPPQMLFWLALTILCIHSREVRPAKSATSGPLPRLAVIGLIPLLVATTWITARHTAFDYYFVQSYTASLKNDPAATVRAADRAIGFGPFNHQIFILQGQGHRMLGNYDQAERALRTCLTYHPYFPNTYNNLGHLYEVQNKNEQALQFYYKALELLPKHYKAHYNLGIAFKKMAQIDSAIASYHRAILFQGDFTKSYLNLGAIYMGLGQPDSAIAYYNKALSGYAPTIEAYFNLGEVYSEQHQFEKAVEAYSLFLTNWKGNPQYEQNARDKLSAAFNGLGLQAEQQSRFDQALEFYQYALHYWPDNALYWYNLGNAYRGGKDWKNAIESYKTSLQKNDTETNTYNNLGLTYMDLNDLPGAIEAYQKALRINPESPLVHFNIGSAYLKSGNAKAAVLAYRKFLSIWRKDLEMAKQVRSLLSQLGENPQDL